MSSEETETPEEKCATCHKPLSQCNCTHHIISKEPNSEGSETKEDLKEKLEMREAQLATISLKAFDEEKQKLLDSISDSKQKQRVDELIGDDVQKLENAKFMTEVLSKALDVGNVRVKGSDEDEDDGTEKVPPKGKVGYPPKGYDNPNATKFERVKAEIDREYATLMNPEATQEQKAIANHRISEMLGQAVRGWRMSGQITRLSVMKCPKCGSVMEHENCATCGFEIPRNQK